MRTKGSRLPAKSKTGIFSASPICFFNKSTLRHLLKGRLECTFQLKAHLKCFSVQLKPNLENFETTIPVPVPFPLEK